MFVADYFIDMVKIWIQNNRRGTNIGRSITVVKWTISLVNRVSVVCSVNSPSIILDLRDSLRSPCTSACVIVIYDIKHLNRRSPLNKGDRYRENK